MSPDKSLLILKTGTTIAELSARGEDFESWFAAGSQVPVERCLVSDISAGETLPGLSAVGAIIVTGSPAYLTDLADWNYAAADYLRQARKLRLPLLGVCYGHQLLAWAFGGEVDFNPAGRQIGSTEIELTTAGRADPLLGPLSPEPRVQVSHQQIVSRAPPDAQILARRAVDPFHALRLDQQTWSVQFHPEFDTRIIAAYINARRSDIEEEGLDADGILAALRPTPEAQRLLSRFAALAV